MTRTTSSRRLRGLTTALAVLLAGGLVACDTSQGMGPDEPGSTPPLPATTSMAVDFSLFASGGGAANAAGTQLHFGNAALRVLAAQFVTVVHLAAPTAVFAVAANNVPSFEDGRWHWRYTTSYQGQPWSADLSGVVSGSDVNWDMRITAPNHNPPLNEFLWYGGTSRVDGTSGTWRFYDPQSSSSSEVVRIDWEHQSLTDHSATITVTGSGLDNTGDRLTAEVDGASRYLTWFDASENATVDIFWDASTGSGYIMATGYNGGLKSCWDNNQNDVACS